VCYWQKIHQGEVDFVAVKDQTITPYQIMWERPSHHHEKALKHFYEAFPQASEAVFITRENATEYV
jgi:hypothetical protein